MSDHFTKKGSVSTSNWVKFDERIEGRDRLYHIIRIVHVPTGAYYIGWCDSRMSLEDRMLNMINAANRRARNAPSDLVKLVDQDTTYKNYKLELLETTDNRLLANRIKYALINDAIAAGDDKIMNESKHRAREIVFGFEDKRGAMRDTIAKAIAAYSPANGYGEEQQAQALQQLEAMGNGTGRIVSLKSGKKVKVS